MVSCSIAQTSSSATSSHNSHKQLRSVHTKTSFSNKPPQSSALRPSSSTKPKVYNVEPIHFRELVQSLTGASPGAPPHSHPPPRLHRAVPPPLLLHSNNNQTSRPLPNYITAAAATSSASLKQFEDKPQPKTECPTGFTMQEPSMELSLSPSFSSLFSFTQLSPTTANIFQHYGGQLK